LGGEWELSYALSYAFGYEVEEAMARLAHRVELRGQHLLSLQIRRMMKGLQKKEVRSGGGDPTSSRSSSSSSTPSPSPLKPSLSPLPPSLSSPLPPPPPPPP